MLYFLPRHAAVTLAVIALLALAPGCGVDSDADGTSGGAADGAVSSPFSDSGVALDTGKPADKDAATGNDDIGRTGGAGTGDAGQAVSDVAPDPCSFPVDPAPGEPGATCSTNADCDANWCVDGVDGKRCTKTCVECCPSGWKCEQAPGSDTTFICIPKLGALCLPCQTDAECDAKSKGALCVTNKAESAGEVVSFCGGECAVTADCPAGFKCAESTGEKGSGKQCVRSSGLCSCTESAKKSGVEAFCSVENASGTCNGTRKCAADGLSTCSAVAAAAETCNGVDDDCNGKTDEDVAAKSCESKNSHGACKGTTVCDGSALKCVGAVPEAEKCDGKDNDCDGATDEGCDEDGDGYCATGVEIVGLPAGCSESAAKCNASGALPVWCPKGIGDCNDNKGAGNKIHPGAAEACGDALDNDCDGSTDVPASAKDEPTGCTLFYADADGDGDGDKGKAACLCAANNDFKVATNTDCNDKDKNIHPKAQEICANGFDDNCNNDQNDNGAKNCVNYWVDEDGDGFGAGASKCHCQPKGKFKAKAGGDCEDTKKLINPKADESCNTVDDNCNGATDEGDAKGCKTWYADTDGDGWGDKSKSACLCAKKAPFLTLQGGDCADDKTTQHPGWKELCHDSIDNNCNGQTDEEDGKLCIDLWQDLDGDGYGNKLKSKCLCDKDPKAGYTVTNGKDCNDNPKTGKLINPDAKEVCDGIDNDCFGGADTGCDSDGDGYCTNSKQVVGKPKSCPKGGGDCNDNIATGKTVNPGAKEVCNGKDDNCKNGTDEGCDDDGDGWCDKLMVTVGKPPACPKGGGDCDDKSNVIYPGRKESCNNINDDCDSMLDEGCDDDKDGYCDEKMTVVGIPKVCAKGPGDCCDVDASVRPKQGAWYATKNKCGSYDYNCSKVSEKRWAIKAAPHHICQGIFCASKAECVAKPSGWQSSPPACGISGTWIFDYDWDGTLKLPLANTCKSAKTEARTQKCH
jgi:hypothetical protein